MSPDECLIYRERDLSGSVQEPLTNMQGAHLVARSSYDLLTKDTPSQRLPLVMRSTWSARTSPSPVACCVQA